MKNTGSAGQIDPIRRTVLAAAAVASTRLLLPAAANANPKPTVPASRPTLNIDHFVQDCVDAHEEQDAQAAVLEALANAVSDPRQMLAAAGGPFRAGIPIMRRSKDPDDFSVRDRGRYRGVCGESPRRGRCRRVAGRRHSFSDQSAASIYGWNSHIRR